MAKRKRGCKSLEYLLSNECIKNCDNVTAYYATLIARIFCDAIIEART